MCGLRVRSLRSIITLRRDVDEAVLANLLVTQARTLEAMGVDAGIALPRRDRCNHFGAIYARTNLWGYAVAVANTCCLACLLYHHDSPCPLQR